VTTAEQFLRSSRVSAELIFKSTSLEFEMKSAERYSHKRVGSFVKIHDVPSRPRFLHFSRAFE
jgi:hypothetical protein